MRKSSKLRTTYQRPQSTDFDRQVQLFDSKGRRAGMRPIRIGVLDIETTDLDPVMGELLCVCIKEVERDTLKGEIHTVRIDDRRNPRKSSDVWVVKKSIDLMNRFDLLVTWYGSRFDIPYMNTKALGYELVPPIKAFRRDLCFIARGIGNLRNNRLATWGRFLFKASGKSFLDPDIWRAARRGDKESIAYIVDHCEKDVVETEKIYKKFIPVMGKLRRR